MANEAELQAQPESEAHLLNLAGVAQHYAQMGIDLKVAESTVPDRVKEHMPGIRNAVLLLSAKAAEDLATLDGKHALHREVRAAINTVLGIGTPAGSPGPAEGTAQPEVWEAHAAPPAALTPEADHAKDEVTPAPAAESGRKGVLQVLFTSFVIQ